MAHNISIACPIVPSHRRGTVGQRHLIPVSCGTYNGTVSLKALADKVLSRDKAGTKRGTGCFIAGTKCLFLVPQHLEEEYEERAAIMEFDGGLSREQAEHAAYEDLTKGTGNGQEERR